ncbi:MAG: 23S rRNA (adenine(2503)-C(2))-methyltransferase RlmN [Candidatus Omnitrophica bacterium]|jgi:23S rRNA (adenine2503-C2)-methyltransferase|nr:23S rRNA (adenine(2503)-C(2))-methyltransferase RlmN [Candidatus Omnitrophota bacterium]
MKDIKRLNLKELEEELQALDVQAYHAKQVFSWIYKKTILDFAQMSDLPKGLRDKLKENFYVSGLKLAQRVKSSDGTEKLLLQLPDANLIEAVIIPAKGRVTGCISTQVGCKWGCAFCASGLKGFKRNLTCSEILDEVLYLKKEALPLALTHLVFMGTGEPLDNYEQVLQAVKVINSPLGFNIGARRITFSTSGLIPGIQKLSGEGLQIELSVSLHAADDALRSKFMPINKKYPLADLIKTCKDYSAKTNRQVTFEYILIKGVNSKLADAQSLSRLFEGWKLAKVNLIPANAISELKVAAPDKKDILLFKDCLVKRGINVTLRKSRGEDINAACGQLRLNYAQE